MENNTPAWVALALAIVGAVKGIWDYLKKRSDNTTSIKINEENKYKVSRDELEVKNKELFSKLTEVEETLEHTSKQLEKALLAFEIIFPLIEDMIKENPAYKKTFERALDVFHEKNKHGN